jgi:hypothetical protein
VEYSLIQQEDLEQDWTECLRALKRRFEEICASANVHGWLRYYRSVKSLIIIRLDYYLTSLLTKIVERYKDEPSNRTAEYRASIQERP